MSPALFLLFSVLLTGGSITGCPNLAVNPPALAAGAFYNGAHVKIQGAVPAGSQAILTVTGAEHEERYNRKARFGPVWIGAGAVRISGAPSLFLRFSTIRVTALLNRDRIAEENLDEPSVTAHLRMQPAPRDASMASLLRSNYIDLKKSSGVYSFGDSGIQLGAPLDGCAPFAIDLDWPKQAPPATYQVRLYEIHSRAVSRTTVASFPVVRTGFPAWLSGLAQEQAPLYGLLAVLIGALAGFGIDFTATRIFGGKRAAAH